MPTIRRKKKRISICQIRGTNDDEIKGYITFTELKNTMKIDIDIYNMPPGKRGFHIHNKGNLREGCSSLCSHFNPTNKKHGKLNSVNSHAGDLGNIVVDEYGTTKTTIYSRFLRNSGKFNIIGRSVVIHEKEDDLGKGDNEESLKTGNAGARIACGLIGIY